MCENLKIGQEYKNFILLNSFELKDYHATAFYMRHKITGLEILSLNCDDEENLFAFNFRTANKKSNGLAHILEHSVLCGSEKFPLKDPFTVLSNQSVKTYLNAATYPEKTVYPASSTVKSDFFNLLNVYADAVFFPNLSEEIFAQEAFHVQLDEKNVPSIQGVVYNEMKGNYSSFENAVFHFPYKELLKSSIYEKDSGGDPEKIPELTYAEYLDFHKKWYRPDNCLLFFYGNIPLSQKIDFLDENFMNRLEKKFGKSDENLKRNFLNSYIESVSSPFLNKPIYKKTFGPGDEKNEKGRTVTLSWKFEHLKTAEELFELIFLTGILLNHDASPLQKVLQETSLGEDTIPGMGLDSRFTPLFTVGLRGVKKFNVKKVKKLIFNTLKDLCKNGVSKKDIASTLMSLEFVHREIRRAHGPYSLNIMTSPVNAWLYGDDIQNSFKLRSVSERIAAKVKNNEHYIEDLIQKYFLDNKNYALCEIIPSKKYLKKRNKTEINLCKKIVEKTSIEEIKIQNKKLKDFQQQKDDVSLLPHLKPSDFINEGKPYLPKFNLHTSKITSENGEEIDFFDCTESTNGITYIKIGFPCDILEASDYIYLPLLSEVISDCGWNNLSWSETAEKTALSTGGIYTNLLTNSFCKTPKSIFDLKEKNYVGRDWLIFNLKVVDEKLKEGLDLLSDNINFVDFKDLKRISDITVECRNDLKSSIIPGGHQFAILRAQRTSSKESAVDEIWNGITLLFNLNEFVKKDPEELSKKFVDLFNKIKNGGSFIHVTTEKEKLDETKELLTQFAKKTHLKKLKIQNNFNLNEFIELTQLPQIENPEFKNENSQNKIKNNYTDEQLIISGQIGFAAMCFDAFPYLESGIEDVCAHWLTNILLWEKLRTIGGSYGAFCDVDAFCEKILFATYRDPTPENSNEVFVECLKEASEKDFTDEEVEKAVVGTYSDYVIPKSPSAKGSRALLCELYGINQEDRLNRVYKILTCDKTLLKKAFAKMYEQVQLKKNTVIITPKKLNQCGKITELSI